METSDSKVRISYKKESEKQLEEELINVRSQLAAEKKRVEELTTGINSLKFNLRLFDSMQEGFGLAEIMLDENGTPYDCVLIEVNAAFGRLTGFSPDMAKGKTARELIPNVEQKWFEILGTVALNGDPKRFEVESPTLKKWFDVYAFCPERGKFGVLFIDVTERKNTEQAFQNLFNTLEQRIAERTQLAEDRAKKLQTLVRELTMAEQKERQHLARFLHDHLQQFLVASKIHCEILVKSINAEQKPIIEHALNNIVQAIKTSRTLTAELSPSVLRHGRLSAALEWLSDWMQEHHGLKVELTTDPRMDPDRQDITVLLFESLRELLFNVVKHAGVQIAYVEMSNINDSLCLSVTDYGVGFDPKKIWEKDGTGFGLLNIRERLSLLGGNLEIESSPGSESRFFLMVPIEITKKKEE